METPRSFIHDLIAEVLPEVETPYSWLYWSLIYSISSSAANNHYLLSFKGNFTYYPNVYIILLGESGLGKAFGITLAKKLLTEADITRVISGRSSIQAIVQELSQTQSAPGKAPITDSRGAIINGELSTAIISDPDALTILTDLFDSNDNPNWTNRLKGDGKEKLKNPYITCLFGSSPAHFYDKIPQANIEGGYISRNLIIYEEQRSKDVDPLDEEEDDKTDKVDKFISIIAPKYVPHLREIAKRVKTRLIPNEAARKIYNTWRREWRNNQAIYNDRTGFINRVPDHVIKVAMCLCLSRYEFSNIIIESDMLEAIEKVTLLVYASKKTSEGTGIDPLAQATKRVIDFLISAESNEMSRKDLLVAGYGNFDPVSLDRIIDTLMEMKWVKRDRLNLGVSGSDWLYKLAGEPLESYKRFKEQRSKK
jgi:hypothetical protein